jgi:alginate O-acetyltransferase complex protein AlgI
MFVWLITGLWHGASINFIIWGMYFGIALLIEKYLLRNILEKLPPFFGHAYCLLIVLYGWVLFYFTDLSEMAIATSRFFGFGGTFADYRAVELLLANLWILPVFAIFSTRAPIRLLNRLNKHLPIAEPVLNFALLCISFILLIGQTFTPFIYFQF